MARALARSNGPRVEGPAESSGFEGFLKGNPASTGILAGVVTMSGQIAAQLQVPGLGCRIVALCFALLLAWYQVGIAQRRPLRESVFLVPVVAVILFTSGWGANGLIYEASAKDGKEPTRVTEPARPQTSLGQWLAGQIVPAAYAQSGGSSGGGSKGKKGGWKPW